MLTANLFSQFTSDPSQVARMVNTMSALMSAACILFLFWSITPVSYTHLFITDKVMRQYPLRMFSELPHAVKRPAAEIAAGRLSVC